MSILIYLYSSHRLHVYNAAKQTKELYAATLNQQEKVYGKLHAR